jgi:two-component system LytT family response regulator
MYNVLIVDDNKLDAEYLANLLIGYKEIKSIGISHTIEDSINYINSLKPNLLFLDVELKEGLCFEIISRTEHKSFSIIFVTAHPQYSLKALKLSAIDYLLKPFDSNDVAEAIKKIKLINVDILDELNAFINSEKTQKCKIAINFISGTYFIPLDHIIRCEADGNYTYFHLCNNEKMLASNQIKVYEQLLSNYFFYRSHRSHIINLKQVKAYIKTDGGYVIMSDGSKLPISSNRKTQLIELINNQIMNI